MCLALVSGSLFFRGTGTGVSPVCRLHDSHGRDARATTLETPWPPHFVSLSTCRAREWLNKYPGRENSEHSIVESRDSWIVLREENGSPSPRGRGPGVRGKRPSHGGARMSSTCDSADAIWLVPFRISNLRLCQRSLTSTWHTVTENQRPPVLRPMAAAVRSSNRLSPAPRLY